MLFISPVLLADEAAPTTEKNHQDQTAFRASLGLARNTAALESSTISYSNEFSSSAYEAESFNAWAGTADVKMESSLNWFDQLWFWDIGLSVSGKNKSTIESGTCLTESQFSNSLYEIDCDVVMEEQLHSLNSSLILLHRLNSNWYLNYGVGGGVYNIRRELRVDAGGDYKSKELQKESIYQLAPQLKLALGYKRFEINYTIAPGIGNADLGEGSFHQIGITYGAWQLK
jgi:hypothetical protein